MFLPNNEPQRLKLLNQYQILNTPQETVFDEIAQLAADICETPIALISLVDEQREWFKSKIGVNISEVPRNLSFGDYIILETEILIIPDILQDERFVNHPLVISHPYCRFYAGVPLINADGFALGSLCVMHTMPRTLNITQAKALKGLGKQVIRLLDLHQHKFLENSQEQREQAEVKLRSALAEKEVLLKEVHHRVKNNLQLVSSLLNLQAQTIKDPQILKAIQESQNRIESISLIHKNLYTNPNIGKIDIAEYINNLVTGILISYQITPGQISLQTNIDSVILNIDQAIACGLIINELISNSLKHAFSDAVSGEISISLYKNKNHDIEIIIRDNGIGLADNIGWNTTSSLGLSLVYDLVTEQLEGSITIERNQGTIFNIQFSQSTLHQSIGHGYT
jgi:two-component sensor histidine kinase